MDVAPERFNNRFNESVPLSLHARGGSLQSDSPQSHAPSRDVVRCEGCSLVQYRTVSDLCRRCDKPLPPRLEPISNGTPAPEALPSPSRLWMAAPPEPPESFPRAILAKQPPPIGRTVQRLREAR